jgi:cobalt-zinc-cadmium resistance protein CzcA
LPKRSSALPRTSSCRPAIASSWAGEFEDLQNAQARLAVIVPISLLLILVLLYGLFNSLRDSLMVLAGIPFAIGGGVIALYFSGLNFSISAASASSPCSACR